MFSSSRSSPVPAAALLTGLSLVLLADGAAARKKLGQEKAAAGLREALTVGAGRAVDTLGAVGGYLENDLVRIEPPKGLRTLGKTLRTLGQGELVDEFETSLNRAAEAAAPLAREVFVDAIKDMSFSDAVRIARGEEHEATDYLEASSRDRLHELFRPIVDGQLDRVGATAAFNRLMDRQTALPFGKKPVIDLGEHVTSGALDGLFKMLALEEERIRTDVLARSTDLLKEVFGDGRKKKRGSWRKKLEELERDIGG